jgi:hypothetical protein
VEELESAPKDVEVAEKEVIKEVPDQKTVKELAVTKAELEKTEKELRAVTSEAEMYKKSAEAARIETKKVKEKAEQEKTALEAKVTELQKAVEKPPDNADKSNFKVMLSTVYRDMLGLVEFINDTKNTEERKQYFKKALEILHVCEDSIKKIELPVDMPKQSLTSRGVVDINNMKPITSSSNADYDDYDYDDEEKDDDE